MVPLDIRLWHVPRCARSSCPLPCPAALLESPLAYLAVLQWPVLQHLMLRIFTADILLRIAERMVVKDRQEKETSQGKKPGAQGHRAC